MTTPTMTFDAAGLLDKEQMRNGPLDVFWGQDEWIAPTRPMLVGDKWPRRKLRQIVLRHRRWHGVVRIAPPDGTDLEAWGQSVAKQLGVPWGEPREGDRAVWLPLTVWARTAGQALGSAGRVFRLLDGFTIKQAQIRVWVVREYPVTNDRTREHELNLMNERTR